MTQISRDDLLKLASLSGLRLIDDEIDGLRSEIQTILKYVEQLDELDTEGVVPAYQVTGLENVYREDSVVSGPITREALLSLAADTKANQIKVPKVL